MALPGGWDLWRLTSGVWGMADPYWTIPVPLHVTQLSEVNSDVSCGACHDIGMPCTKSTSPFIIDWLELMNL